MEDLRDELLRLACPPFSAREQAGSYVDRLETAALWVWQQTIAACVASVSEEHRLSARQLCTLLLTDPEVLDVLLALHDIRAAQLGLSYPPILIRQDRNADACSKWEVPTNHLTKFSRESLQVRAGGK
ncbi:hypothetical protein HaLaN_25940, partial [Haematococcus lacustris]